MRPSSAGKNPAPLVTHQGVEVFYREDGDPGDETLVLLPGFPSSSAQYQALIDELAGRFHLVSPDYPGFGRSPALEGETTFDRIAAVTDLHLLPTGHFATATHSREIAALIVPFLSGLGKG